ncbi:MAG: YitT family protein [Clostridia bacterium]|nr:YitT family protein [Clostridia bacterium]
MKKFSSYCLIAIGTLLLAISLNQFLVPQKISSGGISSIGTVLLYFFKIPLSATTIGLNILLFLLAFRFLGKGTLLRSAAGILLLSAFLQLTSYLPIYTGDLLAATLLGGVLMGAGIGLVVRQGASTGGSDMAALILHRFMPHISMANLILFIDCAIILLAALVFRSVTVACYSLLSMVIAARITDGILTLGNTAKAVQIFSKNYETISSAILDELGRGVTALHSTGQYTKAEGKTLLCVVSPKQLPRLIELIKATDPAAFIVVTDAREVLGEGFKK